MMIAQVCGYEAGELFTHLVMHIYNNHFEQLNCFREPKPLPKMILNPGIKNIRF
jgi:thymidylate synthase